MEGPIMRAINTIVSIGALSGVLVVSSLTLWGCQKKPAEQDTQTPSGQGGETQKLQCGGFGGLQCPDGMTCVDDPSDSCDPMKGGADCMGSCIKGSDVEYEDDDQSGMGDHGHQGDQDVGAKQCNFAADPNKNYIGKSPDACATMKFACDAGQEYFSDECGCGCVTSGMTDPNVTPPPPSTN
jgi:hypothetical protein